MNIKFTGSFAELKAKLISIGGDWDESQPNKKVLRINGGVLNWFESTGNFFVQGRSPGKEEIESSVPHLLYPDE
jgi:cytidine deaminase